MPERLDERLLHGVAKVLCALPRPVQRALSGGRIERDGLVLEPEVALLVRVGDLIERKPRSVAELRLHRNRGARLVGGPRDDLAARDLEVDGAEGPLPARLYPSTTPGAPLLVFFHGGGFVFGDLDSHDASCRFLARHSGLNVLAVAYRLAPEHPFPAGVEDALAAFRWARAHAAELGASTRVGVGGDSAGANLSAVVARLAAGPEGPVAQLLVYPAVDRRRKWPSLDLFAEGFYLTSETIRWFHRQYTGGQIEENPRPAAEPSRRAGPLRPRAGARRDRGVRPATRRGGGLRRGPRGGGESRNLATVRKPRSRLLQHGRSQRGVP